MLDQKLKRNIVMKKVKQWLIIQTLQFHVKRTYEIFTHERDIREIMRKHMLVIMLISIRMKRRMLRFGSNRQIRERKALRMCLITHVGTSLRNTVRERAKHTLKNFLEDSFEQATMFAKVRKRFETFVFIQRIFRAKYAMNFNETWFKQDKIDNSKVAKAIINIILALFVHNCMDAKLQIELADQRFEE